MPLPQLPRAFDHFAMRPGSRREAVRPRRGPTLRFLFSHPAHFVALGFGSGLAPFVPGTFGTLVAIPIALRSTPTATTLPSSSRSRRCSRSARGRRRSPDAISASPDHGSIVIDEVAAFLLVLFFAGGEPLRVAVAFACSGSSTSSSRRRSASRRRAEKRRRRDGRRRPGGALHTRRARRRARLARELRCADDSRRSPSRKRRSTRCRRSANSSTTAGCSAFRPARRSARAASTRISARRCRSTRRSLTARRCMRPAACRRCSASRRSCSRRSSRPRSRGAAMCRSTRRSCRLTSLARPPEYRGCAGRRARNAADQRVRRCRRRTPQFAAGAARRAPGAPGSTPLSDARVAGAIDGRPVACGQATLERDLAGVYDMVTADDLQGRGLATLIVAELLTWAWTHGARHAYLQVNDDNAPARAVYRKFGFAAVYEYHYRARPGECR